MRALTAMNGVQTPRGCAAGSAGVDCAIAKGATLSTYVNAGLGSLGTASPSGPTNSSFPGLNPTFNAMTMLEMNGFSTYNALQVNLRGRLPNVGRFLRTPSIVASYALGPAGRNVGGPSQALANAFGGHFQRSPYRGPDHFVFCKPDGSPLHPNVLRKDVLYPALDKLSIPRPKGAAGFHTFRHSAASFIASQTGNLKLAQKLLGHSNLSTTANVYTHTFANEEREAALAVERAIYGDLFPIIPKTQTGNKTPVVQ